MNTLVIVESPAKAKKIGAMLGDQYTVMASIGHVRDLPQKALGMNPPDFKLEYEATERGAKTLSKLAAAVRSADTVMLATDPDREGEAIAWHLSDALNLPMSQNRVVYNSITKEKILAALAAPREIDMQRVHAQEARRALDRMIGYRVSGPLSDSAGEGLGAGRVQSPAVRLIVDRERAIAAFKSTSHFGAELIFKNDDATSWKAQWDTKPHLADGEQYLLDSALAKRVSDVRNVTVSEYENTEKPRAPDAPFTTSSLQQAAGKRLKFKPKQTMDAAQKLFEAGAITYHRTDSPNMDAEGAADIAAYAQGAGLKLADKARTWKAKEGAQEGHEAIRPSHVADLEMGETDDERALYKLIWQRAVASQLADANYAVRTVKLTADAEGTPVTFKATGRTLLSPGWLSVYADDTADEDDEKDETSNNPIPALTLADALTADNANLLSKKTKPPTRYKLDTLVKEMERLGIGRPSTYAAILDNIMSRDYILEDKKGYLTPSPRGIKICDNLVGKFAFIETDYTRGLEDELDQIAEGKNEYLSVVSGAWNALDVELTGLAAAELAAGHPCPTCAKVLRRRKGENSYFWACSDRECTQQTLPDDDGKPGERKAPPPPTGIMCPKCGEKELARRQGMSKPKKIGWKPQKYDFYSCTGYPKCDAKFNTGADNLPVFEAAAKKA